MKTPVWLSALFVLLCSVVLMSNAAAAAGGSVQGTVYTRNYMSDYKTTSWANITATNGVIVTRARTDADGRYYMFLPTAGTWRVTANVPGYQEVTLVISVSDGSTAPGDFYLQESGIPIPEFHEYATMFITSISLLLMIILMRRRTVLPQQLNLT